MPKMLKTSLIAACLALGFVLLCVAAVQMAHAADKGGPAFQDIVAPKAEPWTGPYIGAAVGWNVGMVSAGGPVGISADGGSVSGVVGYDKQWGSIVGGVGLGYSRFFGDLDTIGVNSDMFGFARLGVLVNSSTLVYGHLGYGRLDTNAGDVDGWRLGPGVEFKLGGPFTLAMEYQYGIYDVKDIAGPGVDARSHSFMTRLNWRPFQ